MKYQKLHNFFFLFSTDVTYGQIFNLCPFEAPLVAFDLEGIHLKAALENSLASIDLSSNRNATYRFLQVSGLKIIYNLRNPIYERIAAIKVRCTHCQAPIYEDFDANRVYRIITTHYLARGGYGFTMFKQYGKNWT